MTNDSFNNVASNITIILLSMMAIAMVLYCIHYVITAIKMGPPKFVRKRKWLMTLIPNTKAAEFWLRMTKGEVSIYKPGSIQVASPTDIRFPAHVTELLACPLFDDYGYAFRITREDGSIFTGELDMFSEDKQSESTAGLSVLLSLRDPLTILMEVKNKEYLGQEAAMHIIAGIVQGALHQFKLEEDRLKVISDNLASWVPSSPKNLPKAEVQKYSIK